MHLKSESYLKIEKLRSSFSNCFHFIAQRFQMHFTSHLPKLMYPIFRKEDLTVVENNSKSLIIKKKLVNFQNQFTTQKSTLEFADEM